jgi:hypothetical protein
MKENENVNRKELESIDSEIFHSFDPEEASWIIGGGVKVTGAVTFADVGGGAVTSDWRVDVEN